MGIFDSIKRKLGYDIKNYNGINEEYSNIYQVGKFIRRQYFKKNGKLDGKYTEYIVDKTDNWIKAEIVYENGLKNGLTKYYWNKQLSAEGNFKNNREIGLIKKYHLISKKDDNLSLVVEVIADLKKGMLEEFSLNGKLLERAKIDGVKFTEGSSSTNEGYRGGIYPLRNGLTEKWYENGNLKEKGNWKKNNTDSIYNLCSRVGEHIQFHENGNEFKKGEWIDKCPDGVHKFYYISGSVEFEVEYSNPKKNNLDYFGNERITMFPEDENIFRERWYNEDGSLMNSNEIIKKGGVDPRIKQRESNSKSDGIRILSNWSDSIDDENLVSINDMEFKRKGVVKFYDSYSYQLGHSYQLISEIKIDTSNLPESPIKSLDDLDPELRKKVEKHTVFVGEDGVLTNIDKDKKEIKNDIFCPKCGSKQNENKFCTNCGNKLVKN
jgi:antitoxin component YwqK of YwqJK toxin-antitoxin module